MRSYYLIIQGAKSANTLVFKDFCNAVELNKNEQKRRSYFISFPLWHNITFVKYYEAYSQYFILWQAGIQ
jgi:hypothetical protein